jgi:hypothetical protein
MPKPTTIIGSGLRFGMLGVGVVALAIGAYVHDQQRQADTAEAAFWSLDGPACPTLDKAAYDAGPGQAKGTIFQDIRFEYRVGHMMCVRRPNERGGGDHPVCQFTGPDLLGVKAPGAEGYFALSGARAARVAVEDGAVRCVVIKGFAMRDHK